MPGTPPGKLGMPTVKLGVTTDEGCTEYRRLVQDNDRKDEKFFTDLKLYAIQLYAGTHDFKPSKAELLRWHVTLSYYDIDGDKTIIGTPEELRGAQTLFKDKGLLSITAKVAPIGYLERLKNIIFSLNWPRCEADLPIMSKGKSL